MTGECPIKVNTPAELIAAVPYLLGFHPADSVVVVALRGRRITFAARYDLPDPGSPKAVARRDAAEVSLVVASQGVTRATVIGYGTADRVTPTVTRLATALEQAGVPVFDQLRVTGGRWWSYLCVDVLCCPAEGKPCLPSDSAIAAAATFSGAVALPDRAAMVAQLAPAGTVPSAVAQERLAGLRARESHEAGFVRKVRRAGRSAVREAERRYRSGRRLTDPEVAWLGVLLACQPVRDYAWERTGDSPWWISLWTDVLRRVEPDFVPAPAGLLAFTAWRAGQGALARAAVDRALEQDPEYEMAGLLHEFLQLGVHPEVLDGWPDIAMRGSAVPPEPSVAEAPPSQLPRRWRVDLPVTEERPARSAMDERTARSVTEEQTARSVMDERVARAVIDERLRRGQPRRSKRRGPRRRAV